MYKETLRGITGIGLFPVISLLLFAAVFVVVLVRTFRMDRSELQHLAGLPLDAPADEGAARKGEAAS
jgi:hypothetical protein